MPKRFLSFALAALLPLSQFLLPAAALSDEPSSPKMEPSTALIDTEGAPAAPPSQTVEISPSPEDLPPEMTEEIPPAEMMPSDETPPPQNDPVPEETPPEASFPLDGPHSETPPAPEETEPSEMEGAAPGETEPSETEEPVPGEAAPPETEEPVPSETPPTPSGTEPVELPAVPDEAGPPVPTESPEATAPPEAVPLPAEPPADAGNEPTYIVKIPSTIDFGEVPQDSGSLTYDFVISARDVSGLGSMELNVVVDSANEFRLLPSEDSGEGPGGLAYQVYTGEDPWSSGEVVASFQSDADVACTAVLDTSQVQGAADLSDTLTFAFVLAPSSPPEEQMEAAPDPEAPFAPTSQLESE